MFEARARSSGLMGVLFCVYLGPWTTNLGKWALAYVGWACMPLMSVSAG